MADALILGGIVFDSYSTPDAMMGGGRQAMVIHKLPGGGRVIDTLGPDEDDITWSGKFFGNDAYDTALALDAMRAEGFVLPLMWGGQYRDVIISHFQYKVRRLPLWVEYTITCTVLDNPSLGDVNISITSNFDSLISTDLSTAFGYQ
jgi:hypothetical protein